MTRSILSVLSGAAVLAVVSQGAFAGVPAVAVPEPSTIAIVAGGIGLLAAARFARRK